MLLEEQPGFADRCPWNKLKGSDWARLLVKQPQFSDKCDWGKLGFDSLVWVFGARPELIDTCDWSKVTKARKAKLLHKWPSLADRIPQA